jgi:ligand-binding sensor domain-containing protein
LEIPTDEKLTTMEVSAKGNIWLGTESGSVIIHKNGMNTLLTRDHGMGNDYINDLLLDSNGNVWIATLGNGISMTYATSFLNLINNKDEFYSSNFLISNFEDNLIFSNQSGVSIMSSNYVINHYSHYLLENLKGVTFYKNKLWAVSFNGIIEVSNDSVFLIKHPLPSQTGYNTNTNISVQNNQLFVNNYNYGWFEYDDKKNKWYRFNELNKLSWTSDLFIDSKNRKWISSNTG